MLDEFWTDLYMARKERDKNKKLRGCHHPGIVDRCAWEIKRIGVKKQCNIHSELNVTPR